MNGSRAKSGSSPGAEQSFLPRYEVVEKLGEGGVAVVYRVLDRTDGSEKALKALKPTQYGSPRAIERFEEEFRILRSLHHPSLPQMHDYGITEDGTRYMVMEYVEGEALNDYFKGHEKELWLLLYEVVEVLEFIHEHSLLHLDLKPGNVLVRRAKAYRGEKPLIMLIDFGLSYRRETGGEVDIVGTPEYMAPELISGKGRVTRAVDYYSLGVMMYELIEGRLPFEGSLDEVLRAQLSKEVEFERERVEFAELYPRIRALMSKHEGERLEAFEEFRRTVAARDAGKIEALERAYGMGYINSLGMIGKSEVWRKLKVWIKDVAQGLRERRDEMRLYGKMTIDTGISAGSERRSKRSKKLKLSLGGLESRELEEKLRENILSEAKTRAAGVPETKGPIKGVARMEVLAGSGGSGKSYLADVVKGEGLIGGFNVVSLGEGGEYETLVSDGTYASTRSRIPIDPQSIIIDRFVKGWERLARMGAEKGVLLMVDGWESLVPEEKEFVEYMGKRLELVIDEGKEPGIFVVAAGRSPRLRRELLEVMPKGEKVDEQIMPLPGENDLEGILSRFHGHMAGVEDRRRLNEYLGKHMESSGALVGALKSSIVAGELERESGRWRFVPSTAVVEKRKPEEDYYRLLLSDMDEQERRVVSWLGAHDSFIDIGEFLTISGMVETDLREAVEKLIPYRLVEIKEEADGERIGIISDVVREALYRELSEKEKKQIHEKYLEYFGRKLEKYRVPAGSTAPGKLGERTKKKRAPSEKRQADSSDRKQLEHIYEVMGFHYEETGEVRQGLLMRIKALKLLKQERDVFGMRRLCAEGVSKARKLRGIEWKNRKWHLERYFIKEWIEAEWLVDNYRNLMDVVKLNIYRRNRVFPLSFLYKYGMALARSGEKDECKRLIAFAKRKAKNRKSEPFILALLIEAALYYSARTHKVSLKLLSRITGARELNPIHSIRIYTYLMLNYKYLGMLDKYYKCYKQTVNMANKHKMYDALIIASYTRIESLFNRSLYAKAKQELKSTIKLAVKLHSYRTLYEIYFLASAVYYEEGNYTKALNFLNKASQIAINLGFMQTVTGYMLHHALIFQRMGRFVDAISYVEYAMTRFLKEQRIDRLFYSTVILLDLYVSINSSKASEYKKKAEALSKKIEGLGRLAYYHFLLGYYYYQRQRYDLAYDEYLKARRLYSFINQDDDVVRSHFGAASVCLETGCYDQIPSILASAREKIKKMESSELRAEYHRLSLAYCYITRMNKKALRDSLRRCENVRGEIKDAKIGMDMDILLFRVNARLGNIRRAIMYFGMYQKKLREIVSNLTNNTLISDFIDKSDLINLAREFKIITRK